MEDYRELLEKLLRKALPYVEQDAENFEDAKKLSLEIKNILDGIDEQN